MTLLGEFLYNLFMSRVEVSPYDAYKEFKRALEEGYEPVGREYRRPSRASYRNVRRYFAWYRKLGLIEFSREEPSSREGLKPKRYYRITEKGRMRPDLWANPMEAIYGESWRARKH